MTDGGFIAMEGWIWQPSTTWWGPKCTEMSTTRSPINWRKRSLVDDGFITELEYSARRGIKVAYVRLDTIGTYLVLIYGVSSVL